MRRLARVSTLSSTLRRRFHVTNDSEMKVQQTKYINALRVVIGAASRTDGLTVDAVAKGLEQVLGDDADPTRYGFSRLVDALREVQDNFYIYNRDTLIPCNWPEVMRKVRLGLPAEGVLLPTFLRHVAHECPRFESESIPGRTVDEWVQQRFPLLIDVSRCSDTGVAVFKRQAPETSSKVAQLRRALQLLGREEDIPVFTPVEAIIPLLPARTQERSWVDMILTKRDVSDAFDVDVDIMLEVPDEVSYDVYVDGSSLSPIEVPSVMNKVVARLDTSSPPGSRETCYDMNVMAFRRVDNSVFNDDDVVVDSFMNPLDELCASLAISFTKKKLSPTVFILVGEDKAAEVDKMLSETFSPAARSSIIIATPTGRWSA